MQRAKQKLPTLHQVVEKARKCYPGLNTVTACEYYSLILNKIIYYAKREHSAETATAEYKLINLLINIGSN